MKVTGTTTLDAPVEKVWASFLDPEVLARTIPGCKELEETAPNEYTATVTVGVGSVKGTYKGKVQLSDLVEHQSLTLHALAAGAAGTMDVGVKVTLADGGDGTTTVDYDADATVGGMIGGVGQRMLTSVSKRMANEFFNSINKAIKGELPAAPPGQAAPVVTSLAGASAPSEVPAATQHSPGIGHVPAGGQQDLLKGLGLGALIALVGVLIGNVLARRR